MGARGLSMILPFSRIIPAAVGEWAAGGPSRSGETVKETVTKARSEVCSLQD